MFCIVGMSEDWRDGMVVMILEFMVMVLMLVRWMQGVMYWFIQLLVEVSDVVMIGILLLVIVIIMWICVLVNVWIIVGLWFRMCICEILYCCMSVVVVVVDGMLLLLCLQIVLMVVVFGDLMLQDLDRGDFVECSCIMRIVCVGCICE